MLKCGRCRAGFLPLDYYESMCAACELKSAKVFLKELGNRSSRDVGLEHQSRKRSNRVPRSLTDRTGSNTDGGYPLLYHTGEGCVMCAKCATDYGGLTIIYQIELSNKIYRGRVVGNLYVVTKRPIGKTAIIATFDTRDEAQDWINSQPD